MILYYILFGLITYIIVMIARSMLPDDDQSQEVVLDELAEQSDNETIKSLIEVVKELESME